MCPRDYCTAEKPRRLNILSFYFQFLNESDKWKANCISFSIFHHNEKMNESIKNFKLNHVNNKACK